MSGFFIPLLWRACPDETGGARRVGWQFKTMTTSITITISITIIKTKSIVTN